MSAHVLLNLSSELWKKKCESSQHFIGILSHFGNEFDKLTYIGAQMLDFIYHMTLNLLLNRILHEKLFLREKHFLCEKRLDFAIYMQYY